MKNWVVEVTERNFQTEVVERSLSAPVVLDFWASWCEPCKVLGPLLEKLASEGKGRFVLAKVDTEANPHLAARFGIQSIPHVMGVQEGRVVDQFVGSLPEPRIREFIDRLAPDRKGRLVAEARAETDPETARRLWEEVLAAEPMHKEARMALARFALMEGKADVADLFLAPLEDARQGDPDLASLFEMVRRAAEVARSGGLEVHRQKVEKAPVDPAVHYGLAEALSALGRNEEALESYLHSVELDATWNESAARKGMLRVFEILGEASSLTRTYRMKLANLIF